MMVMSDDIGYELNERDIEGVINYLKVIDPDNATPEQAIDFLVFNKKLLREGFAELSPDQLDDIYKKFVTQKDSDS